MFRTFCYLGLALCLCCAPTLAQSSYPTAAPRASARNYSRYATPSRSSRSSSRSSSSASVIPPPSVSTPSSTYRQANSGYGAQKSSTRSGRYTGQAARSAASGSAYSGAAQSASSSNYRYGNQSPAYAGNRYGNRVTSTSTYRDINPADPAYGFNPGGSSYQGGYPSEPQVYYNIMTPQCPITHSLVIPAAGGYIHTLACPSVTKSRATFMYAEDAINRGVKPTGTCPQCRAQLPAASPKQNEISAAEARAARDEAVRAEATRRLEEQQHSSRVQKQLQEIEDNRRWDNKMAEWENKAPFYRYTPSYYRRR